MLYSQMIHMEITGSGHVIPNKSRHGINWTTRPNLTNHVIEQLIFDI